LGGTRGAAITKNGCASTPELLSFKQEEQGNDMWVPGGYILYILMSRLPGERLRNLFWRLDRTERDEIRKSFKSWWLYVYLPVFSVSYSFYNMLRARI